MSAATHYTHVSGTCQPPESTNARHPFALVASGLARLFVLPSGDSPSGKRINGEAQGAVNASGLLVYSPLLGEGVRTVDSSILWDEGQDVTRFVGFAESEAGEQLKRLLEVGIHGTKRRMMGQLDRYKVMMPDPASAGIVQFPWIVLYSVRDVDQILSASRHLPIAPAHKAVSRKVEAQLFGQFHFLDQVC